jgi:ABC-type enterochelin transport system permease subunit
MNIQMKVVPAEAAAVSRATPKQWLLTICYLTTIAVAMLGWLSAFGWIAVAIAKRLLG